MRRSIKIASRKLAVLGLRMQTRQPLPAHRRGSFLRRVGKAVAAEFTPPPRPRAAPSARDLAEGHLVVGVIEVAIQEAPGQDVQGQDTLVISAQVPGTGTLHRTALCPLSMPGSGRDLVSQSIAFRHTTFDPDYEADILVVRWPSQVERALEPVRYEGPGALRARIWSLLAGCSFMVMWAGIALTPILLCGIIVGSLSGEFMLDDLLLGVHPGIALVASISAVPLGLFACAGCSLRKDAALGHPTSSDLR